MPCEESLFLTYGNMIIKNVDSDGRGVWPEFVVEPGRIETSTRPVKGSLAGEKDVLFRSR
ncbi:MAG: hypothetical protein CSA33_02225 [Desulfobulbus propionicus]|nr:MAG: hypothetical protein CSA33_02225 [Desulfobulbus propionicus]